MACLIKMCVISSQLEQKGKLQRLIAKDVSTRMFMLHFHYLRRKGGFMNKLTFNYKSHSVFQLMPPDASEIRVLRGHKLPITCLVVTSDDKYIFSAAKDCSIIKCEYILTSRKSLQFNTKGMYT